MLGRATSGLVYVLAAVGFTIGSYFLYPLFNEQSFAGFEDPSPTVVVVQRGSLGGNSSVTATVQVDSPNRSAQLVIDQSDVSDKSSANVEIVVAVERWKGHGLSFTYAPLRCEVETRGEQQKVTARTQPASALDSLYAQAVREKQMTAAPEVSGTVTDLTIPRPSQVVTVTCDLPAFKFVRESLANRNVYLPGMETYAIGGAKPLVRSYSVARQGSDYLVQASQAPSETLANSYVWYERDFELLARQGLFVTESSPALQQESSYRLFVAGSLLGLAGGFLVAAIQSVVGPRRQERGGRRP